MEVINNRIFEGERVLFTQNNLLIDSCTFQNGESPLKEGRNLIISNSTFSWKYPLWYCTNVKVNNSLFNQMARAGIWYTMISGLVILNLFLPRCLEDAKA